VSLLYVLEGHLTLSTPRHCQLTAGELVRLQGAVNLGVEPALADFLAVKIDLFGIA